MATLPLFIQVDPALPEALHAQVYRGIRDALSDGRLSLGDQLPSTRELARDLRVGRNTILRALQRLEAEGLVQGRVGSGVRVSRSLASLVGSAGATPAAAHELIVPSFEAEGHTRPFAMDVPPTDVFPERAWARVAAHRWRRSVGELMEAAEPAGYAPLRQVVADYLHSVRGVACDASRVIITSGSHHALDIAIQAVAQHGDTAWVEDPCRPEVRSVLGSREVGMIAVPVDREGFSVSTALRLGTAKIAVVTPGCHWPSGVAQSLRRRQRLVEWARTTNGWIIEDDNYAVTRFVGRPVPTVHALDDGTRTIHVGTFASIVFPGLRLGYLVLPAALREVVLESLATFTQHAPTSVQAILADFIQEGHFARHLRRVRDTIGERYEAVMGMLSAECGGVLDPVPASAGVNLVAWLPSEVDECATVTAARLAGVDLAGIGEFRVTAGRPGLVLGFGGWNPRALASGVRRLARVLARVRVASRAMDAELSGSDAHVTRARL